MRLPLRFKLSLVCFLGLVILGVGAILLFSQSWVDLSRAYGLLSINRRLESEKPSAHLESGEWALEFSNSSGELSHKWLRSPEGLEANDLTVAAEEVATTVRDTRLASGSFEISLNPEDPSQDYFVAFQEKAGVTHVMATQAHRSLWDLSPWAAPFLGFFLIALGVTTVMIMLMTGHLSRAYSLLGNAMRDVGAGRMENLVLPESSDHSIQELSDSLQEMATLLAAKEEKIAEVSQLADEDAMTGMKNYRAFGNYLEKLFEQNKTKGETFPVLAIVDLDFFKKVNDNYGHQVGDFVLRNTSEIIKKNIRMESKSDRLPDFCGRYGGEEFVVIYSDCKPLSMHIAPMRLMREIKTTKLNIPDEINEMNMPNEMMVSASVGISAWDPTRFSNKEEWIKEADDALYECKKRGRARLIQVHPELREWE